MSRAMIEPAIIFLGLLAIYRITRLVTGDYITDVPRRWLQRHLPHHLAYLVGCPWCASFWLAIPVSWVCVFHTGQHLHGNRWVWVALLSLAGSAVAGQLSNLEHVEDLGTLDDTQPDAGADGE